MLQELRFRVLGFGLILENKVIKATWDGADSFQVRGGQSSWKHAALLGASGLEG